MENLFKEGQIVFERIRPGQKLIIKRCESHLYYCKTQENNNRKDLVYLERDLLSPNNRVQ